MLKNNPNVERVRVAGAKYNDLIGIVLDFNHITNFTEIIETAKQRLGWFTDQIDIRQKVKSGHIPYRFHYVNGNYFVQTEEAESICLIFYAKTLNCHPSQ